MRAVVGDCKNTESVSGGGERESRSLPALVATRHCGGLLWNADLLAGVGAAIASSESASSSLTSADVLLFWGEEGHCQKNMEK